MISSFLLFQKEAFPELRSQGPQPLENSVQLFRSMRGLAGVHLSIQIRRSKFISPAFSLE
jgi:hypothetical protein